MQSISNVRFSAQFHGFLNLFLIPRIRIRKQYDRIGECAFTLAFICPNFRIRVHEIFRCFHSHLEKNCQQFHQNGVKTPSLALNHSIRITHSCNTSNTFFTDLNLTERAKSFTNGAFLFYTFRMILCAIGSHSNFD